MRVYQSESGDYIATDDDGIKARGETPEDAKAAYRAAGGVEEPPEPRAQPPQRRGPR